MKLKRFFWILLICLGIFSCKEDDVNPDTKGDLEDIVYNPTTLNATSPENFPPLPTSPNNPSTIEGVDLGRHLFYDNILSANGTMSCASCHNQSNNFTDNLAVSTGIDGIAGTRSAMSLSNMVYMNGVFMWDGRFESLEEQAIEPIENPIELHDDWGNVERRIQNSSFYPEKFRKAFGISSKSLITKDLIVKALAQFQRTLISGNSKFDKVLRGEAFFTEQEQNGYDIFFDTTIELPDGECGHCHNAPLFNASSFMNNGIDLANDLEDFVDKGRGMITNIPYDNGKFKVPSLRNIELSAPYMHDGRFQTLEQVLNHYNSGGQYSENKEPLIYPLNLSDQHKSDLIAFLKTLTDEEFINDENFSNPF